MSRGMKWGIAAVVLVALGAGGVFFKKQQEKNKATEVRMEPVGRKDLVAAVTASGKIEAETKVDISADVTGRILKIAVKEGDLVTKGQFLMQIDPAQFEGAVNRGQALLASSQASLIQAPGEPRPSQAAARPSAGTAEDQSQPDLGRERRAGAAGL